MRSRFEARVQQEYRDRYAPRWGSDLADRVYTSHLLGAEPSLVLHGGGNTSVKSTARAIGGREVEVLYVKGSGSDLSSIEPAGFPACRLEPLKSYCQLPQLSDEQMVKALRSQMLDPASATPSVEALLHAFVSAKFVDHTHADAVLGIVDTPNSLKYCQDLYGDDLLFVPYVMPGFVLAQAIVRLAQSDPAKLQSETTVMVLDKHGVFTWGNTAQDSYERMIEAVTRAENYAAHRRSTKPGFGDLGGESAAVREQQRRELSLLVRGVVEKSPEGFKALGCWRSDEAILNLFAEPNASELTQLGTATPDHVIRTKPWPLWVEAPAAHSDGAWRERITRAIGDYRTRYEAYFQHNRARHAGGLTRLDALPRLFAFPGLGVFCIGKSLKEARIAGDIYAHTAGVILDATSLGGYQPVSLADLFDVEYWSLEQAKLKLQKQTNAVLGRHVALVTGAASGIGLATAEALLTQGAHVMLSDIDEKTLNTSMNLLSKRFGGQAAACPADVTQEASVVALLHRVVHTFGGLDLVVSNAGNAPSGLLHEEAGNQALMQSLELNLIAHQRIAHHAAQMMIRQGTGGCLLFNASKSAFAPGPQFGPYAVPKAALISLMKQYAIDLARHGIRCNAVNADRVRTRLYSEDLLQSRAKARGLDVNEYFKANLLQRETTARDVAEGFVFLATAGAITGAVLPVDGGNPAAFPR